jgi:hypothetical protein
VSKRSDVFVDVQIPALDKDKEKEKENGGVSMD